MLPFAMQKNHCSLSDRVKSHRNRLSNFVTVPVSFCAIFSRETIYAYKNLDNVFFRDIRAQQGFLFPYPMINFS